MRSLVLVALAVLLAGCATPATPPPPGPAGPAAPPVEGTYGETRILLRPPAPWFVEGIAVHGDRGFSGTAMGATGTGVPVLTRGEPSRIYGFDLASAALLDTILVADEDTASEHGVIGLTTDAAGRLYAGHSQLGVLRFTGGPGGWTQEVYAGLPDLAPCSLAQAPCSPTPDDQPGLANDLAWDPQGNLYVSDSFQATVWRIAPDATGPRTPEPWYQHASLDRAFGPNGLRLSPAGDRMFLAVCCPDGVGVGPLDRGSKVVTLPFPDPGAEAPADFVVLPPGEGADGIAFNATGALYIASNAGNKVFVVDPAGAIARTITNADLSGEGVLQFPASLAFHDAARALVVTNYAYFDATPLVDERYVLSIFVDDTGASPLRPSVP